MPEEGPSKSMERRITMLEKMVELLKALHQSDSMNFELVKIREGYENNEDIDKRVDDLENRLVSSLGRNPFLNGK